MHLTARRFAALTTHLPIVHQELNDGVWGAPPGSSTTHLSTSACRAPGPAEIVFPQTTGRREYSRRSNTGGGPALSFLPLKETPVRTRALPYACPATTPEGTAHVQRIHVPPLLVKLTCRMVDDASTSPWGRTVRCVCAVRALCEKLAVLHHREFGKFRRLKGRH